MPNDIKVVVLINNQWQELTLSKLAVVITPQGTQYTIEGRVKEDEFKPYQ